MKKQHYSYYCNHCREFMSNELCPIHLTKGILVVDAEDSTYIPPAANPLHNGSAWASMVEDVMNESQGQLPLEEHDYQAGDLAVSKSQPDRSEQNFHSNAFYYHEEEEQATEPPPLRIRIVDRSNEYNRSRNPAALRRSLIFISLLFALFAGSTAGYFLYQYMHDDRATLFSTAETLYNNGNYSEALQYYQQFKENYSEDPVLASLDGRIRLLESEFSTSEGRIFSLLEKARFAFQNGQVMSDQEESAVAYLGQVLNYYPNYSEALKLKGTIMEGLQEQVTEALRKQDYKNAIELYKSILKISPQDGYVKSRIEELKKFVQNQQVAERRAEAPLKSKEKQPESFSANAPIEQEVTPKVTEPAEKGYAVIPASQKAPIVKESVIDGGKKHYLVRPKAELPKELSLKSSINVIAECIVGTDGFIQEAKIISRLPGPGYAQHALQTLMRYRFQPATFNGLPIRFKALEVLLLK